MVSVILRRENACPLEERQHVGRRPPLDDSPVCEPHEIAVRPHELAAGGLGAEERFAGVRSPDDRVRGDLVPVADHVRPIDFEGEVRERAPERGVRLDGGAQVNRAPAGVVVDEGARVDEPGRSRLVCVRECVDEAESRISLLASADPASPWRSIGSVPDRLAPFATAPADDGIAPICCIILTMSARPNPR